MMKHKNIILITVMCLAVASGLLSGCGKQSKDLTVEQEVERNLEELVSEEVIGGQNNDKGNNGEETGAGDEKDNIENENVSEDEKLSFGPDTKNTMTDDGLIYIQNSFLGTESLSENYDIRFKIQTDSGVAGIVWGYDPTDENPSYYLWAFDLTRDIPRLYTSKRYGEDSLNEEYTNLDMMYPEMEMFSGSEHIVEISVAGTKVTTYLDSVSVFETTISEPTKIGQIGTWVMEGDYYAYFDDLRVCEGADGSGDYIYVEDFASKASILPSKEGSVEGRYKACPGLTLVPVKE